MEQHKDSMNRNSKQVERDIIIKKRPGTNVKIVEASADDKDLKDRDIAVTCPQSLKISVNRAQKDFNGSPSTITMCG